MNLKLLIIFMLIPNIVFTQEIIAHRGASFIAPENTIAAVKLGYKLDADAVEVDIHLSQDNQLMVIHDKTTQRTTAENRKIDETAAEELRKLEAGSWKDDKFGGEKIPFLQEVLNVVPKGKKLVVEIKSGIETVNFLQQLLEKSSKSKQLIIISFNKETIIQAKKAMPEIPAYWLLHSFLHTSADNAIKVAKENNLQGLNLNYQLVDKDLMKKMKDNDLETYVYTVNDAETAKKLFYLGVKGITTDRPGWIQEALD